jgi:hypothetical protein
VLCASATVQYVGTNTVAFRDSSPYSSTTTLLGIPKNTSDEYFVHKWSPFETPSWQNTNYGSSYWQLHDKGTNYSSGTRTWIATVQWTNTGGMLASDVAGCVMLINDDKTIGDGLLLNAGNVQLTEYNSTWTLMTEGRVDDGEWHIIVATRSAFAGYPGSLWRIYIDGRLAASKDMSTAPKSGVTWSSFTQWAAFDFVGRINQITYVYMHACCVPLPVHDATLYLYMGC